MRTTVNNSEMDSLPPPPYTEAAGTSNAASQPVQASLRGGYVRSSLPTEMPSDEDKLSSVITLSSANSSFEDRDDSDQDRARNSLSLVEYTITFDSETTRGDLAFPLPKETYNARDVTSFDWSTFVNYLFPVHDEGRNGKLRQGEGQPRHSFVGKDTPARRDRVLAVVAEWNENFFNPRRIHISADFSSLPSYPAQSTAIPSAAQGPYVGSRAPQSAQSTMDRDHSAQWSADRSAPQPIRRSSSTSSSSSSGSSSSLSMDSIKSKDLEGADLGQIRSALLAFRLDATKKDHLRASVRQLRDDFRSQRRNLPGKASKELKKEYRNQRKEIKKEVKAVVKDIKATRKADRKIRKAERKSQREGKRAERRDGDRNKERHDKGQRAEERAAEKARRAQDKAREVEGRALEKAAKAHERAREQGATAVARAHERVAEQRAREYSGRATYDVDGAQETGVLG